MTVRCQSEVIPPRIVHLEYPCCERTSTEGEDTITEFRPELMHTFGTPIVAFDMPEHQAINAKLHERIMERRRTDAGIMRSNVGSWHSGEDLVHWGGGAAQKLVETFGNVCSGLTELPNSGSNTLRWIVRMWANVCEAGAFHRQHFHPTAYWSGVYFARFTPRVAVVLGRAKSRPSSTLNLSTDQ